MANILRQPVTKFVTKDGECQITIRLEIALTLNGASVGQVAVENVTQSISDALPVQSPDLDWLLPDFSNVEKIKLGQTVEPR